MKKAIKYGLISIVGLGMIGALVPDPKGADQALAQIEQQADKAEADIKPTDNSKQIAVVEKELKAEPKIKDLMHDSSLAVQWTVGVFDDGSRRFGYASYVCNVIRDGGAMETNGPTYVRVVDVVKVANGTMIRNASLGQVRCDDFEVIER